MRELYVWDESSRVGVFTERDGDISFRYDEQYQGEISQSLPKHGWSSSCAAKNYLLNLIPENSVTLSELLFDKGISSNDTFGILDSMDTAGGFVYTLDAEPPSHKVSPIVPLTPEMIAAQIDSCCSWSSAERTLPMRFSIAGAQTKFTMSLIGQDWFAPSASIPSTHIVKTPSRRFNDVELVENLTMDLAEECGVQVAKHGILDVAGRCSYITERFDRARIGTWGCTRLHVEDFAQALGMPPREKYYSTLEEVVDMLGKASRSEELVYSFLRAYMFGAYAGDADAHIKNFSLVYEDGDVRLSPLYDSVLTSCWPDLDRGLGISLNSTIFHSEYLTERTWRLFSEHVGLDSGRVVDMARDMAYKIEETMPEVLKSLPKDKRELALGTMRHNVENVNRYRPGIESAWNPLYEDDEPPVRASLGCAERDHNVAFAADGHSNTSHEH